MCVATSTNERPRTLKLCTLASCWFLTHAYYNVFTKQTFDTGLGIGLLLDTLTLQFLFSILAGHLYSLCTHGELTTTQHCFNSRSMQLVCLCHFTGAVATNLSYVFLSASFTQVFKALEPLFTSLVHAFVNKELPSVTKFVAVLLIVFGVIVSTKSVETSKTLTYGAFFACTSSLMFPVRNVLLKQDQLFRQREPLNTFTSISVACGKYTGAVSMIKLILFGSALPPQAWVSAFLFAAYQIFSFAFLSETTAATHSIINLFKRTFSLAFSLILMRDVDSSTFYFGAIYIFVGLSIYVRDKHCIIRTYLDHRCLLPLLTTAIVMHAWFFVRRAAGSRLLIPKVHRNDGLSGTAAREIHRTCLNDIRRQILAIFSPVLLPITGKLILIDPAYHSNIGDNMLAYGEFQLLRALKKPYEECGVIQSNGKNQACNFNQFGPNDAALWHAGGNWGDVWRSVHDERLKSFPVLMDRNVTVVGMPQSLHYSNVNLREEDALYITRLIKSGLRLKLAWREEQSHAIATHDYKGAQNMLSPDIAFMIGPIRSSQSLLNPDVNHTDILFLLRQDHESLNTAKFDHAVERILTKASKSWDVVDWDARHRFYNSNAQDIVTEGFTGSSTFEFEKELGSAVAMFTASSVIITDRLHASILAFLMNKPHVYLDQFTRKLSATRSVSFRQSIACKDAKLKHAAAENLQQAVRQALRFLNDET
jgi:exopolysaccharide biosynthesis predicted pyruvyltransferase EpsI/drug/metabolite transporter (DMT)-like permease